ncbi:MAG: hypothetical protein J0I20_10480 [Chloroflexi bacterium]|nr:hypothetical protein [Chloroflexota bacterium]OJV94489.1 MAG: hypothetical protein BGO39_22325 [Chloroflexi bacterium 54-19]
MKVKAVVLLLVVALMGAVVVAPMQAKAAPPAPAGVSVPLTDLVGTVVDGNTITSSVLNVTSFANQGGTLTAIGTVTTTLSNALTGVTQTVAQNVAVPVDLLGSTGSCQILDLVLGPINLNLLGLVVTTNQIHLNITAQSGPGNLVGNLLCAVTNLLNNGGPVSGLVGLLNNILRNL